jgi:hypothetical protein
VDNAELLRLIRKINGDVWLLLGAVVGLLIVVLNHEKEDGRDKEWIYSRLSSLELRQGRHQDDDAAAFTAAQPATGNSAHGHVTTTYGEPAAQAAAGRPARKAAAHKAGA